MHAVKLRPEELVGGPVRSDWLLLCRLRPRGLPKDGDAGGGDTAREKHMKEYSRILRKFFYTYYTNIFYY